MLNGFPPTDTRRCGSISGYSAHQERGERACDACAAAKARYDAELLSVPENKLRNRLHAKAQSRAYRALYHKYRDEYDEIYATERDKLYAEHGLVKRSKA